MCVYIYIYIHIHTHIHTYIVASAASKLDSLGGLAAWQLGDCLLNKIIYIYIYTL